MESSRIQTQSWKSPGIQYHHGKSWTISEYHGNVMEFNPFDARSRYTDFAQTSLRRQKAVYRRYDMLLHAPEVGIPAARCIYASRRKPV